MIENVVYKGNRTRENLVSYKLEKQDIIELAKILEQKAREAINHQISKDVSFQNLAQDERDKISQTTVITITKGTENVTDIATFISSNNLKNIHENIEVVGFMNSFVYQKAKNKFLNNSFDIQIDFKRSEILDFSNPLFPSTKNNSYLHLQGEDETWVKGVRQSLLDFLENKKIKNPITRFIHLKNSYDFLLCLFIPILIILSKKIGGACLPNYIKNNGVGFTWSFYAYIFFMLLLGFRTFYNYSKWIFPTIELKENLSRANGHIFLFSAVIVSIIGSSAYDGIRYAIKLFF